MGGLRMYRLTEAFPYLLNRVGVRMGELFTRRLAAADLTLSMYRVLAALWEKDDQRLGDLARSYQRRAFDLVAHGRKIGASRSRLARAA